MFNHPLLLFLVFLISLPKYTLPCTYRSVSPCNGHGSCTRSGTCLCDLFYYGNECESVVQQNARVSIVQTGISQGDLAGIIIGWMFGIFFLIGLVFNIDDIRINFKIF